MDRWAKTRMKAGRFSFHQRWDVSQKKHSRFNEARLCNILPSDIRDDKEVSKFCTFLGLAWTLLGSCTRRFYHCAIQKLLQCIQVDVDIVFYSIWFVMSLPGMRYWWIWNTKIFILQMGRHSYEDSAYIYASQKRSKFNPSKVIFLFLWSNLN